MSILQEWYELELKAWETIKNEIKKRNEIE